MKVFSIFSKNLKGVARSWPYFAILFICPVLLILIAGSVMNSVDFDNIRVGVIGNSDVDFSNVRNVHHYGSLSDCLFDLTNSKTTICMNSFYDGGGERLDIYLDNSKRIVGLYAKQFIMGSLLDMQTDILDETSMEISSRISLYSSSMVGVRADLVSAREELGDQENLLREYRNDLAEIRSDFDEVYYPLKALEPDIKDMQTDLRNYNNNVNTNVASIRGRVSNIRTSMDGLSVYLNPLLVVGDLTHVAGVFNDIESDLNAIDSSLSTIGGGVDPKVVQVIDNLDAIIVQLDEIKVILDRLDGDLASSIERTRASKNRVDGFITGIDRISGDLSGLDDSISSNNFSFELKEMFDLPKDPVLLAFPLLIALIIMFTSLVLSNMFILKEVNQPSYLREVVSPAGDMSFLVADYLINLFFVAIQTAVLFIVGIQLFSLPVSEISVFALAIFFAASIFIFVGMTIGYLIKHQSLSTLITIFLVMILLVLSDVLAPAALAGNTVKFFIDLNPFMILKKILEDRIVLGRGLKDIFLPFSRLAIFFVVSFVVAYIAKKFSKENI